MRIVGSSDIGMVRKENQDAYWFSPTDHCPCVAVVCDGMGGMNGGRIASNKAVQTVREYYATHPIAEDAEKQMRNLTQVCNQAVLNDAKENLEFMGMGTTMVLAVADHKTVSIANIGDSRGYHITNGNIRQITKDHSAVQELIDIGHLTERQAKIHPNKNNITRAIGVEEVILSDVILLCTDGLTNFVDENEIQFETAGGDFEDLPQRLIELANSRGGADNITVVAIQI